MTIVHSMGMVWTGLDWNGEELWRKSILHVMKARGEGDSLSAFAFARAVELDIHLEVLKTWALVMLMFVAAPRPHPVFKVEVFNALQT